MENPNFLEPASQPQGNIHKFHGTLILTVAIASMVGYFALASQLPLWPFEAPLSFVASTPQPNQRACTQEAKLCPDGTAVGRTGPNCEFAECPGEVNISNWKTYHNDEYGFEFKYPITSIIDELGNINVTVSIEGNRQNPIRVYSEPDSKIYDENSGSFKYVSFYDFAIERIKSECTADAPGETVYCDNVIDSKPISINGIAGYQITLREVKSSTQGSYGTREFFVFDVSDQTDNEQRLLVAYVTNQKISDTLNQILSTFKFIEPAGTSNWKTYRNDEYGFEIKYPGGWDIFPRNDNIDLRKGENIKDIYFELIGDSERINYLKTGIMLGSYNLDGKTWQSFYHQENNPGELGDSRDTLVLITLVNKKYFTIRLTPENDLNLDSEFDQILSTFRFTK